MHEAIQQVDWHRVDGEALDLFRELLRIDTTNAPGQNPDETRAARRLAALFEAEGMAPQVLESAPGRGNVVCRLVGDGSQRPLLLSGHLDVVPAVAARWRHDPFAAEIHDGWLWGRGAVDMKNMVAMSAMVLVILRRLGVPLRRDVIFAGVADEEAGCAHGSLWLAEHHPELIRAEYALSEIGGFTLHNAGRRFYPVQIAEKGLCWMTITARGTAGHGSIPNRDHAVGKIARAAHLLATRRLPHHRTPVVERQLRTLADNLPVPNSLALRALLSKPLCDHVLDHVLPDKNLAATFDAVLHNTANPTILRAGEKINSVPGEASLQVDGRLLPGQTGADLVREVQALIGPEYEIRVDCELPPVVGDGDDPMAGWIAAVLADHDPGGIPVQTMIPGFTDAKAYSKLGTRCWGFSPVRLPPGVSFSAMFHGDDERIPVEGFHWGLRALLDLVLRVAT